MLKPAKDLESVREELEAKGVQFLMASFSDMHGVLKTKMVPLAYISDMMSGSELYTGAALDGVPQDVSDEEVSARPDISSYIILPWQPDVAWFASNLWCEGKPFAACSRNILARVTEAAADLGYVMNPIWLGRGRMPRIRPSSTAGCESFCTAEPRRQAQPPHHCHL